jgi:hypothetical protein
MSGRRIGVAVGIGVVLALFFDLLLQFALNSVRIGPARVSWEAAIVSKSARLMAVGIAMWVAPRLFALARHRIEWPDAFRIAGVVLIAAPLIWTVATVLVFAIRVTLTSAWGSEGQLLLQPPFYSEIVTRDGPWLLAGAALRAVSSHVDGRAD